MAWFKKSKAPLAPVESKKVQMPEGLWTKCKNCNEIIYSKEIERNLNVCPKCDYHFRISARERIELTLDAGTFVEMDGQMESVDFLNFKDSKKYKDRIKAAVKKSGPGDAILCGEGLIEGLPVVIGVFDFGFMGGSMGSVVGEKITRAIERGLENQAPVIIFSSSGGARMQESILSLMQMAKTSAALAKLKAGRHPLHLRAHRPDHRRRNRQLRHARRHQHGRTAGPDRLRRAPGHRADHPPETAGRIPAFRVPAGARHGRHDRAPCRYEGTAGADPESFYPALTRRPAAPSSFLPARRMRRLTACRRAEFFVAHARPSR